MSRSDYMVSCSVVAVVVGASVAECSGVESRVVLSSVVYCAVA